MPNPLIIPDVASVPEYEGRDLGKTDWHRVDQDKIDLFAQATGDDQWIHVDPERARRDSPFGGTIAHGYLTIALIPTLLPDLLRIENSSQIVNSGIENLRLREPVPSGSRIRLGAKIKSARAMKGDAARLALSVRFEVEGTKKPACTGDVVFVYFS